jgi:hypothetical protein
LDWKASFFEKGALRQVLPPDRWQSSRFTAAGRKNIFETIKIIILLWGFPFAKIRELSFAIYRQAQKTKKTVYPPGSSTLPTIFPLLHTSFDIQHSPFDIRHSPFYTHHSPFLILPFAFLLYFW